MATIAEANLTEVERKAVDRFVAAVQEWLGNRLLAVWLYGSRARGKGRGF